MSDSQTRRSAWLVPYGGSMPHRWTRTPKACAASTAGHHVLVARDQHRVGDRAVPGEGLHVGADVGVDALLLAACVQVAEAELDPGHLGDDALVDGGHPVAGRVVPVDAEQFAAEQLVGVLGDGLDEADRVDPVVPARAGAEEQLACGRVDIPDINHDRISGEDGHRGGEFAHRLMTLGQVRPCAGHFTDGMLPCFLGGSVSRLVRRLMQRPGDGGPGFGGADDRVQVAALGGDVGVGEGVLVLGRSSRLAERVGVLGARPARAGRGC